MSSLPQEIHGEILSRLPVKSILRFKSVCRSWRKLLCSKKFVENHHSHTKKNPRLIVIKHAKHSGYGNTFYSVDFTSVLTMSAPSWSTTYKCAGVVLMDNPGKQKSEGYTRILGSCNGLVCLSSSDKNTLILWNPSTKEYKEVIGVMYWLSDSYGFGYDSNLNDYKLVHISGIKEVQVYTLKQDSLRRVNTIPYNSFPELKDLVLDGSQGGLLLNGALHWACTTATNGNCKAIVAFDISNERFKIVPFPKENIPSSSGSLYLRVLDDSLCLVCGVPYVRVEVWVMRNYGVIESWTKQFSSTEHVLVRQPSWKYWSLENGEILIRDSSYFILYHQYHQKNDKMRFLEFEGTGRLGISSEIYVESLVSLNSGTYITSSEED